MKNQTQPFRSGSDLICPGAAMKTRLLSLILSEGMEFADKQPATVD
jgi:hypothetical protein